MTHTSFAEVEEILPEHSRKRECRCMICGDKIQISGDCGVPDDLVDCLPCFKKKKSSM